MLLSPQGISVVIPNYNGRSLLSEILPPLLEALAASGLLNEIIISDDNSNDDSVSFISGRYPEIKLLRQNNNCGFSPTINKGIFASQYSYVFLLNSDVKLTPGYFAPLLKYFDDPDTFGVMGRIIGWEDEEIQDGGKYPSFHGTKIKTSGNFIPVTSVPGDRLPTMYLSGANAFVSREKITALGGFDELFAPFYVEDFEMSLRAWRFGWKCYYEHEAVCRHKTSSSIKSERTKKNIKIIYYRNKLFLHALHLPPYKKALWYLQLIPEVILYLFLGRFWVLVSLKMFFDAQRKIKRSKDIFLKMAGKHHQLLSADEVARQIETSLRNFQIKRF